MAGYGSRGKNIHTPKYPSALGQLQSGDFN